PLLPPGGAGRLGGGPRGPRARRSAARAGRPHGQPLVRRHPRQEGLRRQRGRRDRPADSAPRGTGHRRHRGRAEPRRAHSARAGDAEPPAAHARGDAGLQVTPMETVGDVGPGSPRGRSPFGPTRRRSPSTSINYTRPMKSRISATLLSVSALACCMKPWRAPGKYTRSIRPPALPYALTNASVISVGTLSSTSAWASHTGGSARASPPDTMRVTLASAIAASSVKYPWCDATSRLASKAGPDCGGSCARRATEGWGARGAATGY